MFSSSLQGRIYSVSGKEATPTPGRRGNDLFSVFLLFKAARCSKRLIRLRGPFRFWWCRFCLPWLHLGLGPFREVLSGVWALVRAILSYPHFVRAVEFLWNIPA